MEPRTKKVIVLGVVILLLIVIAVVFLPNTKKMGKTDITQEEKKTQAPVEIVKQFYDWYKTESGNTLDNPKEIAERAKKQGFITPEFATSTIQHPLVTSKKADLFLCASQKKDNVFPSSFSLLPPIATGTIRIEAKSQMPHTIVLDIADNAITSITCPVIPNIE